MPRLKMLVDTPHPDLGLLKKGEVIRVTSDYAREYEKLGFAEETDDDLTPRKSNVCPKCGQTLPLDPERETQTITPADVGELRL